MYHAGRKNWSGFKAIYRQEQRIANWNTISAKTKGRKRGGQARGNSDTAGAAVRASMDFGSTNSAG